jgi:DNA-directed RNA polymerase sigma subunit (sigma70/sigma32)
MAAAANPSSQKKSEPTSEGIAKRMDIPVDKVRGTKKIALQPISLQTPIGDLHRDP